MIEPDLIAAVTGAITDRSFGQLALVNTDQAQALTFLDEERFSQSLLDNQAISGTFVTPQLAGRLRDRRADLCLIEHEDPRWAYFSLYNHIAMRDYVRVPSTISPDAHIHPRAWVSEHNVTIGPGTRIDAFVAILPDVTIGSNCHIQAGTVIGSVGFEYKRTSRGLISVFHDGVVEIENDVEIGSNVSIDKGFKLRPTVIGRSTKIDNLVHIAHSVQIGEECLITAGVIVAGSVTIGDRVWLGINCSISNGLVIEQDAYISLGSVVVKNVPEGERVTGNFAVPHKLFLRNFSISRKN